MIKTSSRAGTYEYEAQEDRSAPRTRISIPAHLRPAGGKRLATTTRDISLSGFAAVALNRLEVGTTCWLTFPEKPAFEAQVAWWEGGIVGCAFKQLLDPADLSHLVDRWR